MSITFIQFMMPDGHKNPISIDRPPEVESLARRLVQAGYRFEIEMLTTGQISMECIHEDDEDGQHALGEICANGPEVPVRVDKMIRETAVLSGIEATS